MIVDPAATEHLRLPSHAPGLRIGLVGGSFNPAHDGHRMASLTALRRLQLDRVWWLVTPGNPLKDNSTLPSLAERIRFARQLADHSRIHVTGIEARLRTRYTADTLRALTRRCPGVNWARSCWPRAGSPRAPALSRQALRGRHCGKGCRSWPMR